MGYTLFTYINRKSFSTNFFSFTPFLSTSRVTLSTTCDIEVIFPLYFLLSLRVNFLLALFHVLSTTVVFVSCLTTRSFLFLLLHYHRGYFSSTFRSYFSPIALFHFIRLRCVCLSLCFSVLYVLSIQSFLLKKRRRGSVDTGFPPRSVYL